MPTYSAKLFQPLRPVEVTRRDLRRLAPHLASSGRLNELLVLDTVRTEDLQRMLIIEATPTVVGGPRGTFVAAHRPRYVIVRKLIARILSRERARMIEVAYGSAT
jgi:hypothetical protein